MGRPALKSPKPLSNQVAMRRYLKMGNLTDVGARDHIEPFAHIRAAFRTLVLEATGGANGKDRIRTRAGQCDRLRRGELGFPALPASFRPDKIVEGN